MSFALGNLARRGHQMRRLAPIIRVLARHGFGHIVQRSHLKHLMPTRIRAHFGKGRVNPQEISAPRRVAMVLEQLGPTFVKLGQMLSTRADLLPESYLTELRKLTERVPPFDGKVAVRIIEKEFGRPITELFAEFNEAPVAAGSIGQVHRATLRDGTPVVVKVKRPNIEKTIIGDLDLLDLVAAQATKIEELQPIRPVVIVEEFRRSLMREVDFISEASFAEKIGADMAGNPRVVIPRVHWGLTSSNVLTMERIEGMSMNAPAEIAASGLDRRRLAYDLTEAFLHMFFDAGLFHADPHPGNIFVLPDGRLALVDFGMAGRLHSDLQRQLSTCFIALVKRDLNMVTDIFLEVGASSEDTDVSRLKADLIDILDKYYGIPLENLDLRRCLSDVMRVARAHHVMLPRDLVLLSKSFVSMVMMARELDPGFSLAVVAKPYALKLLARKFAPGRIGHDMITQAWGLGGMLRQLPRDLRAFSRKLLAGNIQIGLNLKGIDLFVRELDRATNRVAFSMLVSAIIIGSSVLLHAHVPPHLEDIFPGLHHFLSTYMPNTSVLGLSGFLFAGLLGMLLVVAIWRSGRL